MISFNPILLMPKPLNEVRSNVSEFLQLIGIIVFFVAVFSYKPHGMLEYWNVGILGMKSGKRSILQKMLYLHFMMMPVRYPFSAFVPENTPLLRENRYNYIRFDSLNPPFHYPRTHYSIIPAFQHSNWGEAPNLIKGYFNKSDIQNR